MVVYLFLGFESHVLEFQVDLILGILEEQESIEVIGRFRLEAHWDSFSVRNDALLVGKSEFEIIGPFLLYIIDIVDDDRRGLDAVINYLDFPPAPQVPLAYDQVLAVNPL